MKLKPNLSFSEGSSPRVVLQAWNIACAARNSRKIYSNTPQTDLLSRKIKGNHVWTEPEEQQIEWNRRNSVIRSSLHLSGASVLFGVSREANSSKRHARLLAMPRRSVCISQDGQKENHRQGNCVTRTSEREKYLLLRAKSKYWVLEKVLSIIFFFFNLKSFIYYFFCSLHKN